MIKLSDIVSLWDKIKNLFIRFIDTLFGLDNTIDTDCKGCLFAEDRVLRPHTEPCKTCLSHKNERQTCRITVKNKR